MAIVLTPRAPGHLLALSPNHFPLCNASITVPKPDGDIVYICLPSSGLPTVYHWVRSLLWRRSVVFSVPSHPVGLRTLSYGTLSLRVAGLPMSTSKWPGGGVTVRENVAESEIEPEPWSGP